MTDAPTIRIDMHVHSEYSPDASIPVGSLVQAYRQTGIIPLVCDHDRIEGSLRVMEAIHAYDPRIPRVFAEEIKTADGDLVGLFLTERVRPGLSAEETVEIITGQGGLSLVPHPFSRRRSSAMKQRVLDAIIGRIDIIEGYNGRNRFPEDDQKAVAYARRMNKPISAGSDAHMPIELFRNFVEMECFTSPQDFVRCLRHATLHIEGALPKAAAMIR
ncbi:MAG TPA: PHP-associated domain-containing protein [Methanomicrobiales archaeon]|nr:PHP-associated domain-containing protein [Methanomicrobiales archaeon]